MSPSTYTTDVVSNCSVRRSTAGPLLAPWQTNNAGRFAQDSSIDFNPPHAPPFRTPQPLSHLNLPAEYSQASAAGASRHHVSHKLPVLRGEVPRGGELRHGEREADRRNGRVRQTAGIWWVVDKTARRTFANAGRQHRRHDPALRTLTKTYSFDPEAHPCWPKRGRGRAACGQGQGLY